MVNDLRVCARYARARIGRLLSATWGNALPLFTGGQVVAGSNPVSPTHEKALTCIVTNCWRKLPEVLGTSWIPRHAKVLRAAAAFRHRAR